MKLNTKKILREMERLNISHSQMSERMGITRQAWHLYLLRPENKNLQGIERVAKILDVDPKDLLI